MPLGGSSGGGSGKASSGAIKAGEAFVEVSADDSKLKSTLDGIVDKVKRTGAVLRGIGAGAAAAGAAVLAPLVGLFKEYISYADNIQDVADRMEASTEAVSRLGYAAKLSAASLEDIERGNQMLTKSALAAQRGSKEQANAFNMLGVSAQEFLALDADQRFLLISQAFDKLGTSAEKNRLLMALFGKSGAALKPLFKDGAEGLREMLAESDKVGATLSGADAKQAAEIADTWDRTLTALKSTLLSVGSAVLGLGGDIKDLSKWIINVAAGFREWISRNRQVVTIVAGVAAAVTALGAALFALGVILPAIATGFTTIVSIGGAVIGAVFSPMAAVILTVVAALALVTAAIAGLGYLWVKFTPQGQDFWEMLQNIGAIAGTTFSGMLDALMSGDFEKAGKIAMAGLQAAWDEGILYLTKRWIEFKSLFVDSWHFIVFTVKAIFTDFWGFLKLGMIQAITFILTQVLRLVDKLGARKLLQKLGADPQSLLNILKEEEGRLKDELGQKIKPLLDDYHREQAERDKFRLNQIEEQQRKADESRKYLESLTAEERVKADPNVNYVVLKDTEEFGENSQIIADKIASAVKGTFRSADYRGAFAFGPAVEENKKQTKIQEKMLNKLDDIENNTQNIDEFR